MKYLKYHLNRIKYLILILLCITFISNVKAIVKPTDKFYVNDYANILSNETEEYIIEKSLQLYNVDGTQIVVVTVQNLEGMSIEEYSIKVARSFGIGSKDKNNGLLLLIALEERELRIEVGTGLEGIIPDGKAGRFRDQYMIPYLKNDEWDEGIKNGYDAFFKEIVELNSLDLEYSVPERLQNNSKYVIDADSLRFNIIFGACSIVSGIICGINSRNLKKSKKKKHKSNIRFIWDLIYYFCIVTLTGLWIFISEVNEIYISGFICVISLFLSIFCYLANLFKGYSSSGRGSTNSRTTYRSSYSSNSSRRSSHRGGGGSFRGGGASGKF